MPRALVTGGAGFIGSHVADAFRNAGYQVTVIDNLATGRPENLSPGIDLQVVDVSSSDAAEILTSGGFDVVAHLAAQTSVRRSVESPLHDQSTNVAGLVNLLEAARSMPSRHRPRFVFASTGGALYGSALEFPTPESAAADPDSPYGVSKLAGEYYLAYYSRIWDIGSVTLRFANVYGPRQDPHGEAGVVAIFSQALRDGRPLTVFGTGTQTRDYVYVDDVVEAFVAATHRQLLPAGAVTARAFNIGSGVETSVLQLVEELSAVAGVKPDVRFAEARPGEATRSVLQAAKARAHLGWAPRISLREGLTRTYAWVRSTGPGLEQVAGAR